MFATAQLSHLEELNLGGNKLVDLPDAFCALVSLRILFFLGNSFSTIPAVIGKLPMLETLSFKSCKLSVVSSNCLPLSLRALILTSNAISEKLTKVHTRFRDSCVHLTLRPKIGVCSLDSKKHRRTQTSQEDHARSEPAAESTSRNWRVLRLGAYTALQQSFA